MSNGDAGGVKKIDTGAIMIEGTLIDTDKYGRRRKYTESVRMEPTHGYGGFTARLNRDAGSCPVDGTFCYGGGICLDSDPCVSLISSRVPYRESSDVYILAGDDDDRSIVLSIDNGGILLLSSDRNGFINQYGLVV